MDGSVTEFHLDETELLAKAKAFHSAARQHSDDWRTEAREDYGFVTGENQWSDEDKAALRDQMRPATTFNRVGPVVDAVSGSEVNNRQEVRFLPREQGDAKVNELCTAAAKWVRDECNAEDEESDAFFDTIVCGMGWTETRMDYDEDPDGMIRVDRVDPLEMYWSPSATKRNLADGTEIGRKKKISIEDFKQLWPEFADRVSDLAGSWGDADDDDKTPHDADPDLAYKGESGQGGSQSQITVFEYQWCEKRPMVRVVDPATRQIETITPAEFAKLKKAAEATNVPLPPHVKQMQRCYYRAFLAGEMLLEAGALPVKSGFTYKCITGKRDRNRGLWYGIVRAMKDPQRWANKFFSQILHIISTSGKGVMAEKNAFENPRRANEDWAKPDAITFLKEGALAGGKIQAKPGSQLPAGIGDMLQFSVQSIRDSAGVNLELLGQADRMQAGVLEYQRKQSGLTVLATLFDSLRRYRKDQGRLLLEFITEYISDGRLIRVVGENGAQYVPLIRQPGTLKYDVVVDDAPSSPNMKERTWQLLQPLMQPLFGMGLPKEVYLELFKYSPLPDSLMDKIGAMVKNQPPKPDPKQAEAQAKLQIDAQKAQHDAQLSQQKAQADFALKKAQAEQDAALAAQMQAADIQLKREMAAAEMEIQQQKAALEYQLAQQRQAWEAELARENAARQASIAPIRPGGTVG